MSANWRELAQAARQTIMQHDLNQTAALVRCGLAKAFGMEPKDWVSPFTQSTINVTYPAADQEVATPTKPDVTGQDRPPDDLRKLLGLAAIVGAAGLGPALLSAIMLFKQPSPTVPVQSQPIEKLIDNTRDVDVDVKSHYEPEM